MLRHQLLAQQLSGVAYRPALSPPADVYSCRTDNQDVPPQLSSYRFNQHSLHSIKAIRNVNTRFLLLICGDIECNPGPEFDKNKCPCDEDIGRREVNVLYLLCANCNQKWHLQCAGLEEITEKSVVKKIRKWKCFLCYEPPAKMKEKIDAEKEEEVEIDDENPIKGIYKKMKEMNEKIEVLSKKVEKPHSTYSQVAQVANKQIGNNLNKLVNHLHREKNVANPQEEKDKQERTLVVKQYSDKNIKGSRDVRKQVNEAFPGAVIRNARTTAGGSILLELDDQETANNVAANWKDTFFGGNKGIMRGNKPRNAGIIKHVYTNKTEKEIEDEITGKYEGSEVEFFKKNKKFTGTIKVKFSREGDLDDAIRNRIYIFRQRYLVEKYIFKPRVIMCLNCQKYGHVARVCHKENPVCGKCKSEEHDTDNCVVEDGHYKCYHCDGDHQTGSRSCLVHQAKEEELKIRFHNG